MCSIPGLPTPGSLVPVLITRVNLNSTCGLVELWVNLDDGRKPVYEQMREEIQTPERTFYGSEGTPGDLCLVCISDIWHRARIVSIQSEAYNVFLIDQGQPHVTTNEALAWGQSNSFLLPPETESCILANVLYLESNRSEKATNFLLSLPGKNFKGLVQHVLMPDRTILLDIPVVSKHMCMIEAGKKIPVDEFKCLVQKCLEADGITQQQNLNVICQLEKPDQYFYPELLTDTFESVNVTQVTNPGNIFCKFLVFSKAVTKLSEDIQQHYEESSDLGETQPLTCGDPCAARGIDGRWRRSLLKQTMTSDGAVEVLHVDEGKTELVPMGNIRPLHGTFLRMPVFTYLCSLEGVKDNGTVWTTDQTDYLKSLLLNQTVVAKFTHHNIPQDVYHVILYADNAECINNHFISPSEMNSNAQNEPIPSLFLSSLGDEHCMDLQNGRTDDVPTSGANDTHIKESSEHSDPLIHINGQISTSCPSEVQNACHDKVMENVNLLNAQPQYTDHLVDYGHTLAVNESICPSPSGASMAKSVPVKAASLGLFEVPAEAPQEVHQWFADHAVGQHFTISVVAKEEREGKLFVELFYGPLNINVKVREIISEMIQQKMTGFIQQTGQQLTNKSEHASVPNEECLTQELENVSIPKMTEQNQVHSSNGTCVRDELNSQSIANVSSPEIGHEKTVDEGRKPTSDVSLIDKIMEGGDSEMTKPSLTSCPEGNGNICMWPNISPNKTEEVYASCIVGPHYFWCQYTNTEDLNIVSRIAQEAGKAQQDTIFPETLGPGSPCLALFSGDNQWYRAQVIRRVGDAFDVVFIDYGNESDVDIKNVRSLPQSLLEKAPLAFLCSVNGFDESRGSWNDNVYDDFYNLLVDKPLRLTVINMDDHSEVAVPQFAVEIECEGAVVNAAMQKYWKPAAKPCVLIEPPQTETVLQDGQTESNMTHLSVSKENVNTCMYKKPNLSKNKKEEVYASIIVEPHYFWCQYANTKELIKMSRLAQEAGQKQNMMFPETLGPGSPCLALFSSDNQWYRAQVIRRVDNVFSVVFIDYGNKSDVDIKNVRSLPQSLLEKAPLAFLCSLNGFDKSRGSWDDKVYNYFYNILIDKPLRLTVFNKEDHSEIVVPQYAVKIECDNVVINTVMQKFWKPFPTEQVKTEMAQTETLRQDIQTESNMTQLNVSQVNVKTDNITNNSNNKKEEVYASCIVDPHYFWCQYANTEELSKVSRLAQKAGQKQQNMIFPETLGPGSPCLALFSSDNQWYRAQVIRRVDNVFSVVFIDYGNESDVDVKNVRSLPQSLLDKAPLAFLCSLNGFDKSRGSWDDKVYDDFYNLLVDKLLRVTVFNMDDTSEAAVPQFPVEIECEGAIVNVAMQKYWKPVAKERILIEPPQTETVLQDGQTESNMTHLSVSKENVNTCMYKKPNVSKNKKEEVYASSIAEPHYFWCQYANTEELSKVSRLAQEAGQKQQDMMFLKTLGPGSPCLALFSSDNQWYRAQVIRRVGSAFDVVFIDYGNESNVDIKNVRSLPQSLLEKAPQAFLCSLNGFDESRGSWDDEGYDDFYNLLVGKPLRVTVFNTEDHPEIAVPQYAVEIECKGVVVNTLMEKYWKGLDTDNFSGPGGAVSSKAC